MSQAGKLFDGTILPDIETLTGNAGGAVGPTGYNINVVGDGTTIDVTGNPGTSTLTISAMTNAMPPMFLVGQNASPVNVTGDNTQYTMVWDTEIYDIGGNFAANTFTAPVTGKYLLSTNISTLYTAGYSYAIIFIFTSSEQYTFNWGPVPPPGATRNLAQNVSTIASMTAGDTAIVRTVWGNAAKTVGIQGNTGAGSVSTYFCGALLA